MKHILFVLTTISIVLACSKSPDKPASTLHELEEIEYGRLPNMVTSQNEDFYLSFIKDAKNGSSELFYAVLGDSGWENPQKITQGSNWFVNWADYPSVAVHNGNVLAAHWLQKKPGGTYAYDINMSFTAGGQWSSPFTPHNDNTPTEHGFVSMIPITDSSVLAVWLDGRNMTGDPEEYTSNPEHAMNLRGGIIQASGKVDDMVIDNRICDCCDTDMTRIPSGFIAAYRDRSVDEIRDIKVVRFDGKSWSEPTPVADDNWKINACPVNGPSIDASGENVAVAWFTNSDNQPKVYVAFSSDEGTSFNEPVRIDAGRPAGRTDIVHNRDGTAWISWIELVEEGAEIRTALVSGIGDILFTKTISPISRSRNSGFPQMEGSREKIVVSWTEPGVENNDYRIRTSLLLLNE